MNSINFLIPVILLVVLLLVVFLFILLGRITYRANEKTPFSYRNRFPHELYYQRNVQVVSYFRLFLIFLFALTIAIPIFYVSCFFGPSNLAYTIVIAIFYISSAIVDFILFFLKPTFVKPYKVCSVLSIVLMMMACGMTGVVSLSSIFTHVAYKVIASLSFILAFGNLVIALNPKLERWDRLDENKNNDGTITYVRPKISPLAFSLWLNFLSLVLGESLLLISVLFASLGY